MLTYNSSTVLSEGDTWRVFANISPDTSYPAGGYLVRAPNLRLTNIKEFTVPNNPAGLMFNWDSSNSKLQIGSVSGGGSPPTFTGTPMGPHTHSLTMSALGNHVHILRSVTETLTVLPDTYCLVSGATGFFVVGETITGGTSGATATVTVGNGNPTSDLGFTPVAGIFTVGEIITGGTSAVTATVASGWFSIYTPNHTPVLLEGATRASVAGLSLNPTSNDVNADLEIYYNTLVGAFADFETITGGTSNSQAVIMFRNQGSMNVAQTVWGVAGFIMGETITGGTSGATAVVTASQFARDVVHRPTSTTNPGGDFIVFYPVSVNQSPMRFTYMATDGSLPSSAGTPSGTADPVSAGTPAGTISGGGGGVFAELAPGTNVAALLPNFEAIVEGT